MLQRSFSHLTRVSACKFRKPTTFSTRFQLFSGTSSLFRSISSLNEFSDDEKMLRDNVAKFAREFVKPKVKEMDRNNQLDKGVLKAMFENGLMGVEVPTEYGGSGLSFTSSIITIEELAKVDPAVSVVCDVQNTLVNNLLMRYAGQELKKKYLPQLATSKLGCFMLSEWGSGSDAFALKTRAEKKGDEYILNGTKAWITNSGEAEIFAVMANVDPSQGYKGITTFYYRTFKSWLESWKKRRQSWEFELAAHVK